MRRERYAELTQSRLAPRGDTFCLMPISDASGKAVLGFFSYVGEGKERAGTA